MTTTPDLIGSVEAAALLGRSPRTIHRLVATGELPIAFTAPGGRKGAYLFNRVDVEHLAATRTEDTEPDKASA